jgi:2,3-bisphosphoglycerate-dependent phosphoglycerate mutase
VERPPKGESLKDAFGRIMPYVRTEIFTCVRSGEQVLLVAHGNTLRAIIKDIEGISDEDIADVDLPDAVPLVYRHTVRKKWEHIGGAYQHGRPLR